MCYTSVPTDHWLVSMKYAPNETLTIGKGRWTWLLSSLEDQALLEKLEKRGIVFMGDLERLQREQTTRETDNPQTLWNLFKSDIRKIAKAHCRELWSKLTSQITAIEKDLKSITNNPELDNRDNLHTNKAFLANKLAHLE